MNTWIATVDVDVVHGEGIAFPEKWQKDGVKTKVKEHAENFIRCFLVNQVLGLPATDDVVEAVRTVFDHSWSLITRTYPSIQIASRQPGSKANHRLPLCFASSPIKVDVTFGKEKLRLNM
jgi:hypothetical protein